MSDRTGDEVIQAPRLKTGQLALLVAMQSAGSLRGAAEGLHLSQPAATRLLQGLEETVGAQLFERSRQGMTPTPAGRVMMEHARALLTSIRDACVSAREVAEGKAGSVRVGVFGSADPVCLATSILQLKEQSPGVQVEINEAPFEMLMEALHDGDLDLIVSRIQPANLGGAFCYETLYEESFVLVCGAQSEVLRKRGLTSADLIDGTWIVPPSDSLVRPCVDSFFADTFGQVPSNLIESASLLGNLALLSQSSAVAVMARQVADLFAERGVLRVLPIHLGNFMRPVALITLRGAVLQPQLKLLIEELRKAARQ